MAGTRCQEALGYHSPGWFTNPHPRGPGEVSNSCEYNKGPICTTYNRRHYNGEFKCWDGLYSSAARPQWRTAVVGGVPLTSCGCGRVARFLWVACGYGDGKVRVDGRHNANRPDAALIPSSTLNASWVRLALFGNLTIQRQSDHPQNRQGPCSNN